MNTRVKRSVPYVLAVPALILLIVGIQSNDLLLMSFGGLLVLGWSAFELYHPVSRRRTFAARYAVWTTPVALALVALIWIVWGLH